MKTINLYKKQLDIMYPTNINIVFKIIVKLVFNGDRHARNKQEVLT